jgi:hypothetical protein
MNSEHDLAAKMSVLQKLVRDFGIERQIELIVREIHRY